MDDYGLITKLKPIDLFTAMDDEVTADFMPDFDVHADSLTQVDIPPEPQMASRFGCPIRQRRLPRRFLDAAPDESDSEDVGVTPGQQEPSPADPFCIFQTEFNNFGLRKVFRRLNFPSNTPTVDAPVEDGPDTEQTKEIPDPNFLGPFPNESSYHFFRWAYTGSITKSIGEMERLQEIISSKDFVARDVRKLDFRKVAKMLGTCTLNDSFDVRDGWIMRDLTIEVPVGHIDKHGPRCSNFSVKNFLYRPLVRVICSVFESRASSGFVYEPCELKFKSPAGGEMNTYGELYWSRAFRTVHEEVLRLPRDCNDRLPRAVAVLQLWSDGMSATKFGRAKLWPAYLQFGNQSKYDRGKPGTCHHIAHIPSVSEQILILYLLVF